MKSIQATVTCEWSVQKSRFIGFLSPATTTEQAKAFVAWCRQAHPGAAHVCHAFLLSSEGGTQQASDDGEPSKTAGVPMLELLKKNDLTDVVAVAVRYFGGVKLGTGGLIRAYAKTIRSCIEQAAFTFPESFDECRLSIDYSWSGAIGPYLRSVAELKESVYADQVIFTFVCPSADTARIQEEIKKRTSSGLEAEIVRKWVKYQ